MNEQVPEINNANTNLEGTVTTESANKAVLCLSESALRKMLIGKEELKVMNNKTRETFYLTYSRGEWVFKGRAMGCEGVQVLARALSLVNLIREADLVLSGKKSLVPEYQDEPLDYLKNLVARKEVG